MKLILFIILCALVVPLSSDAEPPPPALKIGVIDSTRLLAGYYKTPQAEESVREGRELATKQIEERGTRHRELVARLQDVMKLVHDPAISEDLRAQKRQEGEALAGETRSLEQEIREFRLRRERQLQEQVARLNRGLVAEIRTSVERQARERGFDLLIDKAAAGLNGFPFLIYSKDAADFTEEALRELNRAAPEAE